MLVYPKRGVSYTYKEIITDLYLRDNPSLLFEYNGKSGVIQDAHVPDGDITVVPGMSESRWVYIRETREWIPIFKFDTQTDQLPITSLVDLEVNKSKYYHPDFWWATPKGFPRDKHEC
jgi:hypothetical protein